MFGKGILTDLAIGLITSILILIVEKFLKSIIKNKKFINSLLKFKLLLLHFLITYIIWFLGREETIGIRLFAILVINLIILATRMKESQINGNVSLKYKRDPFYKIKVYKLKQNNKYEKLQLSWEAFGKCIENLIEIIKNAPAVAPDIIFGINETGIMAASCLSNHISSRPRIGIIKTGSKLPLSGNRQILQFDCPGSEVIQFDRTNVHFPNIENPKTIAIVDIEIKTGKSIKCIMEMLKQKYGQEIDIYYIVLAGVIREDEKEKNINDIKIFGWDIEEKKYKPDFLSCYIDSPGVRGPGGLR